MKRNTYALVLSFGAILFILCFFGCKKTQKIENTNSIIKETPVSGSTNILVEESIYPIVEDVNSVFESEYNNISINLIKKSENEILDLIYKDSLRIAILPRKLDSVEVSHFEGKVVPKMTLFAFDAIVFVANKSYKDTVVDYENLIKDIQKTNFNDDKLLIFDNVNSNISEQFRKVTGLRDLHKENVFFLPTTEKVIEYVHNNPKAIGVIGLNWLVQPNPEIKEFLNDIKVLSVRNQDDGQFYKPSQVNIAERRYPLVRELYVLDFQGKTGLGVGFASYIAGYKGQRIILKSGLAPFKVYPREIIVRKNIE